MRKAPTIFGGRSFLRLISVARKLAVIKQVLNQRQLPLRVGRGSCDNICMPCNLRTSHRLVMMTVAKLQDTPCLPKWHPDLLNT